MELITKNNNIVISNNKRLNLFIVFYFHTYT